MKTKKILINLKKRISKNHKKLKFLFKKKYIKILIDQMRLLAIYKEELRVYRLIYSTTVSMFAD